MRSGQATAIGALETLRAVLALEEGEDVSPRASDPQPFGALAAAGSRAAEDPAAYSFVMESVLEGYLLHYGRPRLAGIEDIDLRLLAGDLAYALGLARLAEVGDLAAVTELGDLISLCAQVHTEGRAGTDPQADSLLAGLWALGALAVGTGSWAGYEEVKQAVRAAQPGARERALAEARGRATQAGAGDQLTGALIAFRRMFHAPLRST